MAILNISRDWGDNPSIVRVVTTDSLSTVLTTGYITSQAANIAAIQNGVFEWRKTDYVLIAGITSATNFTLTFEGFFNVSSDFTSFDMSNVSSMVTQVVLSSAQIKAMSVTPVQILPPLPDNFLYVLQYIQGTYVFNTAAYTGGGAIGFEWSDTALLAGPAASSTLAGATFDGYVASNTFVLTPNNTNTLANIEGMGVWVSNNTAPFATGSGSLIFAVNYQIIPGP